jgi:membrane fusion protein, copper/silver efflux system
MNRSERKWLISGLFIGAVVVAAFFAGRQYLTSVRPTEAVTTQPVSAAPEPTPDSAAANSGSVTSVELSDEEQKMIGIETAEVQRRSIQKQIVVPGKVAEPETGMTAISARIGGRIEKLLLKATGETVSRGQAVAFIYSPEVFTAGEEYKLALGNRQRLAASKESQAITEADELVRASRRRLELRGLTSEQIEQIASSAETSVEIATYSSTSGIVTRRNVTEGEYVKEGDTLYTVVDLSTVWVEAQIFESDIPLIRNGQAVRITSPAVSASLRGTVAFLQPSIDPQTRTMIARIQVPNPQMRLRPGMFVQVSLDIPLGSDIVAVPRSAVLDTGEEKVVYVARENGLFEKRSIQVAGATDDYYAATKGIQPGERVVTHGNFLIDSQTRLSGSITGMFGGSKAFGTETPVPSSGSANANYTVTLRTEPTPAKGGSDGMFHVAVAGPDGKPVSDAQVQVTLFMPAMPAMGMGEMKSSVNLSWNGSEYVGTGPIAMSGSWTVTVEARRAGQLLGIYRTRLDAK